MQTLAEIIPQLDLFHPTNDKTPKRELTELEKFGEFRKYCYGRAKEQWNHDL